LPAPVAQTLFRQGLARRAGSLCRGSLVRVERARGRANKCLSVAEQVVFGGNALIQALAAEDASNAPRGSIYVGWLAVTSCGVLLAGILANASKMPQTALSNCGCGYCPAPPRHRFLYWQISIG